MSHATPLKPNRIQQTLRRYFLRILPRPLTLVEDPMAQLNRLMQWDMHQIDDREYRRRLLGRRHRRHPVTAIPRHCFAGMGGLHRRQDC